MAKTLEQIIYEIGIVPVVKVDRVEDALPLGKALMDGGIPCAEVTFRTEHGKEAIRLMAEAYPDMMVGAGTVLTTQQVDDAIEAGAKFIVSPGLNPETVKHCQKRNIPIFPGCANASDIESALSLGLELVKFFPAEVNGGIEAIKALAGPFPNVRFMPTGGVNTGNILKYLDDPRIVACGGTWMVKDEYLNTGNFDKVRDVSKEAVQQMLGFEIAHIGVNSEQTDPNDVDLFSKLFDTKPRETSSSLFISDLIEVMNKNGRGKFGHIALKTNNAQRAKAFLERQGFTFDESSAKEENGKLKLVYMNEEIAGFAIHLIQK